MRSCSVKRLAPHTNDIVVLVLLLYQAWNPNWDPKADGMSLAISLGQPSDLEAAAARIKTVCEVVGRGAVM